MEPKFTQPDLPMSGDVKAKLASHKLTKRQRTVLLKDLAPWELLAHIDRAEEEKGLALSADLVNVHVAYLSRASADQLDALKTRLPHVSIWIMRFHSSSLVPCFEAQALELVLGDVLTTPSKNIKRLRKPLTTPSTLERVHDPRAGER